MSVTGEVLRTMPAPRSFADFYRDEIDGQVRRAALLVGSTDLANDIVHDAFVEVYRRWERLDRPGGYLNRAVLNGCRDVGRSRRVHGRLMRRLVVRDEPGEHEPLADVLDGLPFNQRAVIVLRYYAGLTNVEIARVLGCPPGSVGPWMSRALERLRKELS